MTSWIHALPAATVLDGVLAHRDPLARRFRAFYAHLWDATRVPTRTLELCRLRIAAIHDCETAWRERRADVPLADAELDDLWRGEFARFSRDERAALAVAERMPFAHHDIGDTDVAAARASLGEAGTVALLTAIAFFDVTCRWQLVFGGDPTET